MFKNGEVVLEDIEQAKKLIKGEVDKPWLFRKHGTSFLFTTENQEGISKIIDYREKKVLMPSSSGDQYLSGMYYGAASIDLFDINRITYYLTYLKIAAVITLDYEEFIKFFMPYDKSNDVNPLFWDLRIFKKVVQALPLYVAYFWDNILYEIQKNGLGDLILPWSQKTKDENIKRGMPFYQNREEYYKLQARLRNCGYPLFIESDIATLGTFLNSEYDILYLSNIVSCVVADEMSKYRYTSLYQESIIEHEKTLGILKSLLTFLKKTGVILVDYRPNRSSKNETDWLYSNDFFDVDEVPAKYPPHDYQGENTDLVLTYRPTRKANILN